jgi:hypothetical protein
MASFNVALKPDLRREVAAELQPVLADLLDRSRESRPIGTSSARSFRQSTPSWTTSWRMSERGPTRLRSA